MSSGSTFFSTAPTASPTWNEEKRRTRGIRLIKRTRAKAFECSVAESTRINVCFSFVPMLFFCVLVAISRYFWEERGHLEILSVETKFDSKKRKIATKARHSLSFLFICLCWVNAVTGRGRSELPPYLRTSLPPRPIPLVRISVSVFSSDS